ncbi:MAG: hypothetical protein KC620_08995, partial [Myxococcales bacterium]|nr:hypothetical protein [Myxococcales bacterium]
AFAHQPDGRRHAANYLRGLGGAALVEQQNHLLARALAELGQPGEAAAVFAAMIEAPTHPPTSALEAELRVRLAAARLDAGEPGTALSVLDEGLAGCTSPRLDAQAAFCSVTRGRALDALKRPDEAEVALHQAADIDPVAAEALPAVAEARFLLAERQFAALDAAHADLTAMRTEFDALDAAYARVSALDDPRWRVAATYRRGVLQQALADRLRADPKRAAEASRAGQVALEHFGAAVRLARAHDVRTPWSRAADEQVSRLGESPN